MQYQTIRLAQFLKWKRLVNSGGEAKFKIQGKEVLLNGNIETQRGKQLTTGDIVTFNGIEYKVLLE